MSGTLPGPSEPGPLALTQTCSFQGLLLGPILGVLVPVTPPTGPGASCGQTQFRPLSPRPSHQVGGHEALSSLNSSSHHVSRGGSWSAGLLPVPLIVHRGWERLRESKGQAQGRTRASGQNWAPRPAGSSEGPSPPATVVCLVSLPRRSWTSGALPTTRTAGGSPLCSTRLWWGATPAAASCCCTTGPSWAWPTRTAGRRSTRCSRLSGGGGAELGTGQGAWAHRGARIRDPGPRGWGSGCWGLTEGGGEGAWPPKREGWGCRHWNPEGTWVGTASWASEGPGWTPGPRNDRWGDDLGRQEGTGAAEGRRAGGAGRPAQRRV